MQIFQLVSALWYHIYSDGQYMQYLSDLTQIVYLISEIQYNMRCTTVY